MMEEIRETNYSDLKGRPLTKTEIAILQYLAMGLKDKQIAERLDISFRTVTTHMSRITAKLDIHGRTAIALYATRVGIA